MDSLTVVRVRANAHGCQAIEDEAGTGVWQAVAFGIVAFFASRRLVVVVAAVVAAVCGGRACACMNAGILIS